MELGARDNCVAGGDGIEAKMAILKQLGYDFVELTLSREQVEGLDESISGAYREMQERTGLSIASTSVGHFPRFSEKDAAERARIAGHVQSTIAFTNAIGGDAILLATEEANDVPVSSYAGVYREAILPLADEALDAGVVLALEHVGWYKPYRLAQLVRLIDHPAVRIYFDMGNCLYVGENPLEQARICGPLTGHLHVKGGPVAPLASMPLVEVREILQAAGFNGRACLEIASGKGDRPLAEARGLLKMAGYVG